MDPVIPEHPSFPQLSVGADAEALGAMLIELRTPMTVILGRAQLLARHIQGGQVTDVEACLATLATIEVAVSGMDATLLAMDQEHRPAGDAEAREGA